MLLVQDEGARSTLFRDGRVLRAGDVLRQPRLAATLGALADHGAAAFYDGPLAESLVALLRGKGSAMTLADFRAHRVSVGSPLSLPFGELEYLTSGDNTQGTFFLEGLNALQEIVAEQGPLDQLGADAGVVARVLSVVAADRDRLLADPTTTELPTSWLLSRQRALEVAADARLAPRTTDGKPALRAGGDTVAVVTVDADGNWVSLIQSAFTRSVQACWIRSPASSCTIEAPRSRSTRELPTTCARQPSSTHADARTRSTRRGVCCCPRRDGRKGAVPGSHPPGAASGCRGHAQESVFAPRWVLGAMEDAENFGGKLPEFDVAVLKTEDNAG